MHAILMTTLPHFLLEHKNSTHFFEICLPPEDSPWMKQAVGVSFEVFCIKKVVAFDIDRQIPLRHISILNVTGFVQGSAEQD